MSILPFTKHKQNDDSKMSVYGSRSYAQSGEDLLIDYVLKIHFGINMPSYLDIGAYDPIKFSNTYLFYERGAKGVLIEPDPDLANILEEKRSRDKILNFGISNKKATKNFYLISPPTLNTFSKKDLEQYKLFYPNVSLRKVMKIRTVPITNILESYFEDGLDLLSIDVEGLDYEILSNIDFSKHRPAVICIESVEYKNGNMWEKPQTIPKLLFRNSYFLYADTFINSIYVDSQRWSEHKQPRLKGFKGR